MMLRTACIFEPGHPGFLVSVMSRHTMNDGVTPDPRLDRSWANRVPYHAWWKHLAPDGKTVGALYRNEISWEGFEAAYLKKLGHLEEDLKALAELAHHSTVTLLCVEPGPEKCHRSLLAREVLRYRPSLQVVIS